MKKTTNILRDSFFFGDHQSHEVKKEDLKNLLHCLTKTIHKGAEETPDFRVRILNDSQFEEGRYNDGRSALWIEEKKMASEPKRTKADQANSGGVTRGEFGKFESA